MKEKGELDGKDRQPKIEISSFLPNLAKKKTEKWNHGNVKDKFRRPFQVIAEFRSEPYGRMGQPVRIFASCLKLRQYPP